MNWKYQLSWLQINLMKSLLNSINIYRTDIRLMYGTDIENWKTLRCWVCHCSVSFNSAAEGLCTDTGRHNAICVHYNNRVWFRVCLAPYPHTNCEPHRGPPMRLPIDASLIIAPLNGRSCWFSHTNITVSCCLTKANITLCWQLRRQLRARDRESGKQTDWLPDWLMAISREGHFYFQMQVNFNVDTAGAKARH